MNSFFLAVSITCFASTLQGVAGFGAGLISMGFLSSIWSVPQATAVMIPLVTLLNTSLIVQHYNNINLLSLKWIIIGIPLGVLVGIYSLETLSETVLKILLGLALLASVINTLVRDRPQRDYGKCPSLLAGTCAGIFGSAFSTAGPPLLIYATLQGWNKEKFRAQLAVLFMTSSSFTLIGLSIRGQISLDTLSTSLSLTPGVLLGSLFGVKIGVFLPQKVFQYLVLGLLTFLAAKFLINAIVL